VNLGERFRVVRGVFRTMKRVDATVFSTASRPSASSNAFAAGRTPTRWRIQAAWRASTLWIPTAACSTAGALMCGACALYAATHNPFLQDTLVYYDNLATRIWCLLLQRLSGVAGHVDEHGPLLEAVAAGDADKAADLARAHVIDFEREVRGAL